MTKSNEKLKQRSQPSKVSLRRSSQRLGSSQATCSKRPNLLVGNLEVEVEEEAVVVGEVVVVDEDEVGTDEMLLNNTKNIIIKRINSTETVL